METKWCGTYLVQRDHFVDEQLALIIQSVLLEEKSHLVTRLNEIVFLVLVARIIGRGKDSTPFGRRIHRQLLAGSQQLVHLLLREEIIDDNVAVFLELKLQKK